MEQQKLPNVTAAIVLAIIGYVCCCIWGLPAILMGGIGLVLLRSDAKKYAENPEGYSNYNTWKTARILCIVAVVIGALYFGLSLYRIYEMGGWEAAMEQSRSILENWGIEE
ncbi:CCC motif membrane protein [Robiginitalea sp. M366]|uniref:CCC motif membrane protein n=1 Tax=Robiginitalea aestuariiviva TaxID=3036903 RepID=UPI00240DA4DB|nr:CCC motif membrane protein [Robiginitalea aestuariiviva]MDG1572415.1 CCC motif membrane protein [Robiginitalea aestuariiviva]